MRVALLTREYPPEVYGGAGVHVEYLARELRAFEDVDVHCWGSPREDATAHQPWTALAGDAPELSALRAVSIDLTMAAGAADADITHTHTWYAQFGGHLAKLLYDIPHVATVHSLEPLRPWKEEQLGGGYRLSSFCERTALENADAVIAVSNGTKRDILGVYPAIDPDRVHVIYNGIDTGEYTPDPGTDVLERLGIDPGKPSVAFVGRITRQKGVSYLLQAARHFDPSAQLVLCAGSADTPELGAEVESLVDELRATREGVFWIEQMLPKPEVIQILSRTRRCSRARRSTSRSGSSTSRRWPARPRSSPPRPAASSRSSSTARPASSCRSSPATTAPARRASRSASRPTSPSASTRCSPTRTAPLRWAAPGRRRAVESFAWPAIAEQTSKLYRSL